MLIEHHLPIDAPVEDLWALFIDLPRLAEVSPVMSAVEQLDAGPVGVGVRLRVTQPGAAPKLWTAVDVEEPVRTTWSTPFHGGTMLVVRELTSLGEARCLLTLQIEVAGVRAQFAAAARRLALARGMEAEAEAFAAAVTGRDDRDDGVGRRGASG